MDFRGQGRVTKNILRLREPVTIEVIVPEQKLRAPLS